MHRVGWLLVVLAAAAVGGCGPKRQPDAAAFDAGYAAFQAGQWQVAVDRFTQYLRSDPATPTRGEVYYYRGQAQLHLNRRGDARSDFLGAIGAEARPPIDQFARVAIGNLYYEEGDDARAVEQYAAVVKAPHKDVPMDMVLLRVGVSLQRLGKWSVADKYFQHLLVKYPGTPASVEASRRIRVTAFTVQTGAFAAMTTASGQAGQLRAAGFEPRIATVRGSRTLHAVQVGSLSTYREAEALAQRVRQAGFSALIVP